MTAVPKRHMIRYNRGETRAAWICLLPSVIGLVCITYIPMIASFTLSLFNWNGLGELKYIGLDNYIRLFTRDTKFYGSLLTTLEYACLSVIGSIIYSMIIAMLLNRKVPARGFSERYSICLTCCRYWLFISGGNGSLIIITDCSTI